jgi:hypothetical protein
MYKYREDGVLGYATECHWSGTTRHRFEQLETRWVESIAFSDFLTRIGGCCRILRST